MAYETNWIDQAILEVLRDPRSAEVQWSQVVQRIRELVDQDVVRAALLGAEAARETRVVARERWAEVAA